MIIFDGIYESKTRGLKLIRFSNNKSCIDIIIDEKVADHIARNLEKLAVKKEDLYVEPSNQE